MQTITRTIYGVALQTALNQRLPHAIKENSTLNELFNIEAGVMPGNNDTPAVRYVAIGTGGHGFEIDTDGTPYQVLKQHAATDAACFKHIPFVLRELNNDLSPTERPKYALRKEVTYNGARYVAYFLRRMDLANSTVEMRRKTVNPDGTITTEPFVPTSSNLNPTPTELENGSNNDLVAEYVVASSVQKLEFTAADISELINVANIMFGKPARAIISEIALVSGVDRVIQVQSGANTIQFNEVIGAQVSTFIGQIILAAHLRDGVTITLDMGSMEPLFKLA